MVGELAIKHCRWCRMTEEERLDDLFKDEQLKYTSIHLHALSYTV